MIITFAGHRSFIKSKAHEDKILALLEDILKSNTATFYLGGYGSFDDFARRCCQKYKESHPDASLIFITPYISPKCNLELYDDTIYPQLEEKPIKFAITYRNRWMVERADVLICAVSHAFGGAYATYKHAKRRGKRIFNIFDVDI